MSRLNFGLYARRLKGASSLDKVEIVEILVDGLIEGSGDIIDTSDKYKLFNSKLDRQDLKEAAATIKIKDSIKQYFEDYVIPCLIDLKINELIELLKVSIECDDYIVEQDKAELLQNANKENLAEFLSVVFRFAALQPNNVKDENIKAISMRIKNAITLSDGKIYLNGEEILLPEKLVPPESVENIEIVYITEILKAYAEAENIKDLTIDNLPDKYKKEIERHRQDFFNAEAVNRRLRETYSEEQNEFELLKQETYDGIIDTHSLPHPNAYERLLKVLQQAVGLQQGKSLLWKLPKWIGASEKKGICHILVNDGQITWVVKDE